MRTPGGVLGTRALWLGRRPTFEAVCERLDGIHERLYLDLEPLQALFGNGQARQVAP